MNVAGLIASRFRFCRFWSALAVGIVAASAGCNTHPAVTTKQSVAKEVDPTEELVESVREDFADRPITRPVAG